MEKRKQEAENQGITPAPEMPWNRLIFQVTLDPCFITLLFNRDPCPILSQSGYGCHSHCSAALRTVTIWMSAVSLVLLGYGSAKPYMCRSCQLAICPYVLKISCPLPTGCVVTIRKHCCKQGEKEALRAAVILPLGNKVFQRGSDDPELFLAKTRHAAGGVC